MAARGHTQQRRPAAGIRWDRVGRFCALAVAVGVLLLYVGPAVSYVKTLKESKARSAEVTALEAEKARLLAKRKALKQPATMEREARDLGLVKPGERAYVIKGLPKD
jgi:cell division protein FtsB